MPMTGLATFEQPLSLVAGYDFVVEPLLDTTVVQIVVDHLVAEGGPRDRSAIERIDRVSQRGREPLGIRLVRVALERRRQLESLLEAVQACGDHRREREVRVDVASGDPRLDALRAAVPDDAKAARAVVVTPRERGRRPRTGRVALVRVDVRREEERELPR